MRGPKNEPGPRVSEVSSGKHIYEHTVSVFLFDWMCVRVDSCSLQNNHIEDEGARALAEVLQSNRKLTTLK